MRCYECGTTFEYKEFVPFKAVCDSCAAYAHCCCNCVFYNDHATHECDIADVEWVGDKTKANLCEEFKPMGNPRERVCQETERHARQRLDELFG